MLLTERAPQPSKMIHIDSSAVLEEDTSIAPWSSKMIHSIVSWSSKMVHIDSFKVLEEDTYA